MITEKETRIASLRRLKKNLLVSSKPWLMTPKSQRKLLKEVCGMKAVLEQESDNPWAQRQLSRPMFKKLIPADERRFTTIRHINELKHEMNLRGYKIPNLPDSELPIIDCNYDDHNKHQECPHRLKCRIRSDEP